MRTSWVYSTRGSNFLLSILRLASEREELSIVADQVGAPTTAKLIADTTALCIRQAVHEKQKEDFTSGLYHLTTSGSTSWHGFAKQIVSLANEKLGMKLLVKAINPIPTSDYPTPAKRPQSSRLSTDKLQSTFDVIMPEWKSELKFCIDEFHCKGE